MATLSEVTLQHSRDLSALDADCRAQQEAIERARQNALQGLAAAAPALRQYNDARNEAATIRDNTVAHAAAALEAARLQARDERFDQLDTVQQQYVAADRAADDAKAAAQKKENDAYQAKLATINALPLGQQFAAREAAAAEHDKALAAIEAAWRVAYDTNRNKQQTASQGALDKERLAEDAAVRARDAAAAAADVTFQAAIALARTKLDDALAVIPDAAAITTDFDKRRAAARQDCKAREDALFEKFREALKTATG